MRSVKFVVEIIFNGSDAALWPHLGIQRQYLHDVLATGSAILMWRSAGRTFYSGGGLVGTSTSEMS